MIFKANLRRNLEAANAQIRALNDQNDDLRDQVCILLYDRYFC